MRLREAFVAAGVPIAPDDHHHVTEQWFGIDCFLCSPNSRKWHMGISNSGGVSCWRCGKKKLGEVLSALSYQYPALRENYKEVIFAPGARKERPTGTYKEPVSGPLALAHRRYLAGRGFDPDEIARVWGVTGIDYKGGEYTWRLLIPVTADGIDGSWTTRTVTKNPDILRYVHAPPARERFPIKSLLYGADMARGACVVHEGPADVWRTGPGAVATFGINYTRAQLLKLTRFPLVCVCFDNEPLAQVQALKLCDELESFGVTTYNAVLSGKDAASSPVDEVKSLRDKFLRRGR